MKTTKTIEEYYCDFCGAECTHNHYDITLPFITSIGCNERECNVIVIVCTLHSLSLHPMDIQADSVQASQMIILL